MFSAVRTRHLVAFGGFCILVIYYYCLMEGGYPFVAIFGSGLLFSVLSVLAVPRNDTPIIETMMLLRGYKPPNKGHYFAPVLVHPDGSIKPRKTHTARRLYARTVDKRELDRYPSVHWNPTENPKRVLILGKVYYADHTDADYEQEESEDS